MSATGVNVGRGPARLLEAVAKSIKHATAMSTILATELFQARCDSALANSKLLLDSSSYELRNAPINSKTLFGAELKKLRRIIMRRNNRDF